MSWEQPLWQAILARATGDTGSGGLFNPSAPLITAFYNNFIPQNQSGTITDLPFAVFMLPSAANVDGFRTLMRNITARISIYTERFPTTAGDGLATANLIIERFMGDWTAQTYGTGPTYGYDRWQPSPTGYTASVFAHTNTIEAHTDSVYCFNLEFKLLLSKAAA